LKIKLAICLDEDIYQERFVKCLMKHYSKEYEFHIFSSMEELQEEKSAYYDVYILSESDSYKSQWAEEKALRTLWLKEEDKYQEVYRIMELVEIMLSNQGIRPVVPGRELLKVIGVYSLTSPALQFPYATILSDILGEHRKVILLDLQQFSGFAKRGELGMEDAVSMAIAQNFIRGRMQDIIGHTPNWDYIFPFKNSNYLLEGNKDVYESLVRYLEQELGYDTVVINFGEGSMTFSEMKDICHQIFLLCPKGNGCNWREKTWKEELERKGEQDVLHRIQRMEIPSVSCTDMEWDRLVESWKWGSVGDLLRKVINEEKAIG